MEGEKFGDRRVEKQAGVDKPPFMSRAGVLAEFALFREGQRVAIETEDATFKGIISFVDGRGGQHAFSMKLTEPANLEGAELEFISPTEAATGNVPTDKNQCFRYNVIPRDRSGGQSEKWSWVRQVISS